MASHDDNASKNDMSLALKHKVFLSHSGAQKGFVEQLDLDLRQRDRHSFFDKNRESLPIGEVFPPLVFKAIQQCEVGVVVLSDKFLSSKWPMLELVEMVKTMANESGKMKILPIFLDVLVDDLGDEKKLRIWRKEWEKIALFDERINTLEWEGALKKLKPMNGLVYNSKDGEVKFREEIADEICKIVLPFLSWDDSHVQGKSRYIKIIESKIKETLVSTTYKVQVVGLYGVGGIGKTTTCKLLCNHFAKHFNGRVCHVEFGNGTEIDLLRMILKKLTKTTHKHLKELSIDQCRAQLRNIMQTGRVFLAMDNVSSDSKVIDEAKRYLGAGYENGSIVVVTARSLEELKNVRIDVDACLPMPEFEEDEAMNLFLYHAAPKDEVDQKITRKCINRCYFRKGDGSYHYHPLALEVLGKQLGPSDPEEWELQLLEEDTNSFNTLRESENPIFSILRRSFDALTQEDKELFIDIVVYHSEPVYNFNRIWLLLNHWKVYEDYGLKGKSYWNIFEWLGIAHGLRTDEVKRRLRSLKSKSLLEDLGNGRTIGMHDLWKEFALLEIKVGEIESRRWVYECDMGEGVNMNPKEVQVKGSILIDGGWKKLERINISHRLKFQFQPFERRRSFSHSPNVKVLRLTDVNIGKKELALRGMKQLRILEIFTQYRNKCTIKAIIGIEHLTNLQVFIWTNIDAVYIGFGEQISSLRNIQVLHLEFSFIYGKTKFFHKNRALSLDLRKLPLLQIARINFLHDFGISGFTSRMIKLLVLDLSSCGRLLNCHCIGDIISLEVLHLRDCQNLESLPNLQELRNLLILNISLCRFLTEVRGLERLVALQELNAEGCSKLQSLPNLSNLTNLQVLNLKDCNMIESIPGLSNLISLERFSVGRNSLGDFLDSGKLMKLSKVYIHGYAHRSKLRHMLSSADDGSIKDKKKSEGILMKLSKVYIRGYVHRSKLKHMLSSEDDGSRKDNKKSEGESQEVLNLATFESILTLELQSLDCQLTHLLKLTRLEDLYIAFLSGFESLPDMGKNMRLKSLRLHGSSGIRGWDGVGGSELLQSNTNVKLGCNWTLAYLIELSIDTPAFRLPDLSHFPQLMTLSLSVPSGSGCYCSRVVLECCDDHQHLKYLNIHGWPFTELLDLSKLCALEFLAVSTCNELTSLTSTKPLMTMKVLFLWNCKDLKELPATCHMKGLEDFAVTNCGVTLSALEYEELPSYCRINGQRKEEFLKSNNTRE